VLGAVRRDAHALARQPGEPDASHAHTLSHGTDAGTAWTAPPGPIVAA
jgi:hypothetical protein